MDGHCARRRAEKEAGGRMDERAGGRMDGHAGAGAGELERGTKSVGL